MSWLSKFLGQVVSKDAVMREVWKALSTKLQPEVLAVVMAEVEKILDKHLK